METLPIEIIITIFDFIEWITDKRRISQTCKLYNNIMNEYIKCMGSYNKIIYNTYPKIFSMGNELCRDPFFQDNVNYTDKYCVEKFTLELCHDNYLDLLPMKYLIPENKIIVTILILFGETELLKIALINGCKLHNIIDRKTFNYNSCDFAAIGGNIDILQLVRLRGCEWDGKTCKYAAYYGHLHVIRYLIDNGCELDLGTCINAAKMGHLHILEWWKEENILWDPEVCAAAASHGQLEIIIWLRENGCEWDCQTCVEAAANGHLNVLKWARENGCDWDCRTCTVAAGHGHLDILEWAIKNGCDLNISETYYFATNSNTINVIKWMRENNYEWDAKTCLGAAQSGNLELLEWVIKEGCIWDHAIYIWAIKYENTEILDLMLKYDDKLGEEILKLIVEFAEKHKLTKISNWLKNSKYQF